MSIKNDEFYYLIDDIVSNKNFQKLKNFNQHYDTSCYEHCYRASYYCYKISKKFGWDYVSLTRAAMLHDFFLYDWHDKTVDRKGLHAFTHPEQACLNASILFDLNEKEKSIIKTHMWPVTLKDYPKSKEGLLLTFVDKYCAISESISYYKKVYNDNTTLKYAYLLICFVILKISKFKSLALLALFR